ncbi:SPOR domain-containing protein [Methylobacterium sp. J-077]|uniref:SPOR domain-containing protein n=1 Tax=Methylobacterium sp. J-077 TaxID=2836656 RepID=UPI001FB8C04A|nr:SPOR domain-containing protein [Methylobacterium sp. J-077]MCJ2125100.1 SPOR domain-containing protein [Methylobacterium sp. J-077]
MSEQSATSAPSEREKWEADNSIRERELATKQKEAFTNEAKLNLQRDELDIRIKEHNRSRFTNPLFVAVVTGVLTVAVSTVSLIWNANVQREIEASKAKAARILESLKANSPDKAADNLDFLIKSGLLTEPGRIEKINTYLRARKPGEGPNISVESTVSNSGFSVQLAVRSTEQEAVQAINDIKARYPAISNEPIVIISAEVNGKRLYRARLGPYSKADASSVCQALQAAGGQCFVAKGGGPSNEILTSSPNYDSVFVPLPPSRP